MSILAKHRLSWKEIEAVAEFCAIRPQSAYNIAVGFRDWKKARPQIVRHLYQQGWTPKGGRAQVRDWLNGFAVGA